MKIKTKLYISVILSLCMSLLTGTVLFISTLQIDEAEERNRIAVAIAKDISELRSIIFDYFMHHEERSKMQWQSKYDSITRLITGKEFKNPEAQIILQDINKNLKGIKPLFFELIEIYEKGEGGIELRERLSSNIIVKTQAMLSDAYRLSEVVRTDMISSQRRANISVMLTIGIFVVIIAAILYLFNKSVAKPLKRLHEGTEIIGKGNLDYKVGTDAKDEIGQFSRVFDRMVESLKAVMASRDELNREIEERKKVEEALRRSEERYRNIVDTALAGIYESTPKGEIHFANEALARMFDFDSPEEIIKSGAWARWKDPKDRMRMIEELKKKGKIESFEGEMITKTGRSINILFNAILTEDAFRGVVLDVTERKRAEELLKKTAEELARSNEELQQFAYIASHDLQEPLRMVSSYVKLIERRYKDKLDKDADEFIAFAVDGANRMKEMIEGLLEYARVQTRAKPLVLTDCEGILSDVLNNLQMAIEENNAVITHDHLPDVLADDVQIGRVFQNLIGNAIKFHKKEESPRIHISAREEGREWVFSFQDNGIGIKPQYKDGLFTMFKRAYSRKEYTGIGIGLAISRRIVERHGGRIWVESEYEKGATFYFTIPIKEGTKPPSPQPSPTSP